MHYISSLTQKGQVTIPLAIRKSLGLKPGQRVSFIQKGNDVVISSQNDFLSLKGSIASPNTFDNDTADKDVLAYLSSEYAKKNSRS